MICVMARQGNRAAALLALILVAAIMGRAAADTVLRIGVLGVPPTKGQPYASMNAPTIYTWAAVFDSLTFVGHDGQVRPWLATSWRNLDPLTWEFSLRQGVTFSNGEPFTADAVVNAVGYLTSAEAQGDVVATMLNSLDRAWAVGDETVIIKTKTPNPMLPREAATLRVVAPRHWRALGPDGFALQPHGTGPFQVERFEDGRVLMKANPGSWRPPTFERLDVRAVPDGPSRIQGILSGQLDIILGTSPDQLQSLTDAGHQVDVVQGSGAFGFSFILNPKHPNFGPGSTPLLDVRVRQALNYGVNKERLVAGLIDGRTTVASQPAPPIAFGYDPDLKPYPYDPGKAKALLAEAGYPEGFDLVLEVNPGGSIPNGAAIYQQMAEDLRAIGVRVELRTFSMLQYLRALHQGEFKGQGFVMDFPAAPSMDALRAMKLHSCWWKTPFLCVPEDQVLIDSIAQEFDMDRRRSMTQSLMRRYYDQAYAIYLFNMVDFYGIRKGLTGFEAESLFIRYDLIRDAAVE